MNEISRLSSGSEGDKVAIRKILKSLYGPETLKNFTMSEKVEGKQMLSTDVIGFINGKYAYK